MKHLAQWFIPGALRVSGKRLLLLSVVALLTGVGTTEAQVNWVQDPRSAPSARCCMGMAYDAATHSTLFFGGFVPGVDYGDTWIWKGGWSQQFPATSPSAREGAGVAYDRATGKVVLFGGLDSAGTSLNDTWTWDGTNWTQQFPPVSPPGRRFETQGMAYDATTRTVILFGGTDSAQNVFGDTWTWDGRAKTWTQ